ncbi:hypothetical protein [Streptococcus didelphis]|uniref:hypothetical protein n=1 Tax=Streptococcus didelphis TaxID=102886 RepID=UPI00386510CA
MRNLSYLSDNEKIEYRYLKAKMDAVTSDYQAGFEQDRDYKSSSYGSNYQVYQPGYSENLYEGSNPDDLPLYPQEEHLSRKERRSRKKRQQEYEQSQDFYEEDFYDKKAKKAPRKKEVYPFI